MDSCIYRDRKEFLKKGDKYWTFYGSKENLMKYGAWVLKESISLFHRKRNPIRYFSVDELNHMNVECNHKVCNLYPGSWEEKAVLVKLEKVPLVYSFEAFLVPILREIVVGAQVSTHDNFHKLLGCCLETEFPVLVYEWIEGETLEDRIIPNGRNNMKEPLEWKDRLRIAWEVSHAIAYLHMAFPRPIVHTDVTSGVVFLDNNVAKLYCLGDSVCIPEGEEFVTPSTISGDDGYVAPELYKHGQAAESIDVYSFGMLLHDLFTATNVSKITHNSTALEEWGQPATAIEELQLKASLHLVRSCIVEEAYCRPTMEEVATELKNIIRSPDSIPSTSFFEERGLYRNFHGSEETFMKFKALLLQESFSLFHDRANPIHYFSVVELNNMNVERVKVFEDYYRGSLKGRPVLVKLLNTLTNKIQSSTLREVVVATQMATHNNVQKLLGCCIETKFPVLVYEWVAAETLEDYILPKDENQRKLPPLEWKDRLRIAWEISHAISDLQTTFPWPIIHGNLKLENIFMDPKGSIKLSNFNHYLSIPKGEEFAMKDCRIETISCWMRLDNYKDISVAECADVFSFGMLFLVLLTGKRTRYLGYSNLECLTDTVDWVIKLIRMGRLSEIIDPAINTNEVVTIQLSASIELVLRCTTCLGDCRPTMADVATELDKIIHSLDSIPAAITFQGEEMCRVFRGSKETFQQNEALLLEEGISLFPGRSNLIRYFSVDELNNMNIEYFRVFWDGDFNWYEGSWAGKVVWAKLPYRLFDLECMYFSNDIRLTLLREVVVATQITSHKNLHKLLGCCLETKYPVLVYEGVAADQSLENRILLKDDQNQNKLPLLEWKDRLRIAWELSHAISYLHTALPRPIVHNGLKLNCVFLDQDNTVKLSKFCLSVSIPEGVEFLEDVDFGYSCKVENHYREQFGDSENVTVAECTDVYAFGIIFLVLLTGKPPYFPRTRYSSAKLIGWVTERIRKECASKIVDPAIQKDGVTIAAMTASLKLALRCTAPRDKRPTMVDVAAKLEEIIRSSDLPKNIFSLLRRACITS